MANNFRPPAVPLVTVDPYFSVWSAADHLYDDHTKHWTGQRNSMTGMIMIDGQVRRFMGKIGLDADVNDHEPEVATQKSLEVNPLSSKYIFKTGGISLEIDFTTPLLPGNLDILSRPASYITFSVRSNDGKPHDVKIYFDVTGEWCVNTEDQKVIWSREDLGGGIDAMRMGSEEQAVLQRDGDDVRIDWGYLYLVTPQTDRIQTVIHSYDIRKQFIETGEVPSTDDQRQPRTVEDGTPVMAAVIDFGQVSENADSNFLVLAYDDIYSIEYFGKSLAAYWRKDGMTIGQMLVSAVEQYNEIMKTCGEFNRQLMNDSMNAGGQKYADMLSLAYRQAIAAHKLVVDDNGEILFLSKECFSNGCIGTVDVSYPSIPLFLHYNPELVKGMMRPIFRYANSGTWPYDFAPHDVGRYPKANGQVYGQNKIEYQMPIEECGNMLIMAAAVCLFENNADFAEKNWGLLTQWANYLRENGLDPQNQLCTDDFAGHLEHNVNLSVKAIVGIGAYSILCRMLGKTDAMNQYLTASGEMAAQWETIANAGDHYKLTFDSTSETWSLKYNLVWDKILGLHLFPEEIAEKEVSYYFLKQNRYGTPLDNRNTYTKSDWLVWSASLANTKDDFAKMITPLWDFLNESPSRIPFTDWYDTVTGRQVTNQTHTGKEIGFQNRTVVGGIFIKLLKPFAWEDNERPFV